MTPVLLVPGLGLGSECWAPLVQSLHAAGELDPALVITAVVAGYGCPAGRRDSLAPADLAGRLIDQGLLESPALVIALSAGCQVAAHLALEAPGHVTGLVLIGPTTDPRDAAWPRLVLRWLRTAWAEPVQQVPVLLRQYRRTGVTTMFRAMNRVRHDRIDVTLAQVECPVLVIRGAHDDIARQDWVESLARRVVTLGEGAHMVPYTHAAAVARHITDFVHSER